MSRTLDQWLDPVLATQHGPDGATRLREIAEARAMRRGMWAAVCGLGVSAVVIGVALLWVEAALAASVSLLIGGGTLTASALHFLRREHLRVPARGESYSTRGAGTLSGGIMAAAGIFVLANVFLSPAMTSVGEIALLTLIDAGLLLLLVSVFVIPAAIIGHDRDTLRRQIRGDPRLAAAVDIDRATWKPHGATVMFGPL